LDALADGVPVEGCAVEPAQVDEFGVDARLLDRLGAVDDHGEVTDDGDVATFTADARLAKRQLVVVVARGNLLHGAVQVNVFDDEHGIVKGKGGVHEADVVGRARGGNDAPAGARGEDAGGVHEVLRTVP